MADGSRIHIKSKETIILSVLVEKGIVLWWRDDGNKTISPNFGWCINFGELIFDKCKVQEHTHPPLSQRETSNDPEKFVNLDLNNYFFINNPPKFFKISGENKIKILTTLPELLSTQFAPARGPPYFEV